MGKREANDEMDGVVEEESRTRKKGCYTSDFSVCLNEEENWMEGTRKTGCMAENKKNG